MDIDKDELMRWVSAVLITLILMSGIILSVQQTRTHTENMAKQGYTEVMAGRVWIWQKACPEIGKK